MPYYFRKLLLFLLIAVASETAFAALPPVFHIFYEEGAKPLPSEILGMIEQADQEYLSLLQIPADSMYADVSIFIHIYDRPTIDASLENTRYESMWSNGMLVARLYILHPDCFTGEFKDAVGALMDDRYYSKLVLHEISTAYLEYAMYQNSALRFDKYPAWFVQGLEEWMGIEFSDPYWRQTGYRQYIRQSADTSAIHFEYGIHVENPYRDGFTLVRFMADQFGWDSILRILYTREHHFGAALQTAVECSYAEFQDKYANWKKRLQQHF